MPLRYWLERTVISVCLKAFFKIVHQNYKIMSEILLDLRLHSRLALSKKHFRKKRVKN